MRSRLVPVLFLACWPFAVAACAVDDDADVRAEGSTTTSVEDQGTTTTEEEPASTTTTEEPADEPVTVADVIAAFEADGYEVTQLEMEAPSARPDDALSHQLLEIEGGDVDGPTDIEIWTFADADAAEDGADDVRDEATDEEATGGGFAVSNGTVVGLLGCTCEADSMLADVFVGLDLSSGAEPSNPTTSTTDPRIIPDDDPDGDDDRLEIVLDEMEAAGATVLGTSKVDEDLGADVAAAVEVEVDGEVEVVEVHVFSDSDLAFEVAMAVEDAADEYCDDLCDEIMPVAVPVGEVVFVADDGAAVLDVIEDIELP